MQTNTLPGKTLLHACALVMPQWPDRLTAWRALVNEEHGSAQYFQSVNVHANHDHEDSRANFMRMACAIARVGDEGITVVIQSASEMTIALDCV